MFPDTDLVFIVFQTECLFEDEPLCQLNSLCVFQAIPELKETASQTDWRYPRNAHTQYTPREFTEQEKQQQLESEDLSTFLKNVLPRYWTIQVTKTIGPDSNSTRSFQDLRQGGQDPKS